MLNSKIHVAFWWDAAEVGYNVSKPFIKNAEQVIFEYFVQRFFLCVSYFRAQVVCTHSLMVNLN